MSRDVILYKSNAGHTEAYARMLAKRLDLRLVSWKDATKEIDVSDPVIYFGWVMGGTVSGLDKALKKFAVSAVCAVGAMPEEDTIKKLRERHHLSDSFPLFWLAGGLEQNKLKGVYKLMISIVSKSVTKKLSSQKDRTEQDDLALEMFTKGKNCVDEKNLEEVIYWHSHNFSGM